MHGRRRDVHVALLGPLRVEAEAHEISIAGPKRRLLMARLAMEPGRIVSTDALVADLWGERPPSSPKTTLQSHISHLRQALGRAGDVVVTGPGGYCLDIPADHVDAKVFEATVRTASALASPDARSEALASALARWRGAALHGLGDEGWAHIEAGRLEELRLQAIEDRIAADLQLGRARAVVPELSALVQAHPLRENTWIQLMRALSACGRHAEALRAAQDLRAILGDIGLEAGPDLAELEAGILAHQAGRPPSAQPVAPITARPERGGIRTGALPFVGRENLLRRLRELAAEAEADGPRFVVIAGEPGVGKSRLVDEISAEAAARGHLVLVGRCDEDVDAPFQPFAEMAASLLARPDAPVEDDSRAQGLGWLVPEMLPGRPRVAPSPEAEQDRRFRDVAAWLGAETRLRTVVMVIEDVQWAALPSLLLLRHILRRRTKSSLLVVMTCRTTEGREVSPAERVLLDVWSDEAVHHLSVPSLTVEETAELVHRWPEAGSLVERGDVGATARALWDRTGGNPLFLRELVRHLWESGRQLGDQEREGVGPEAVPHRIRTIVDQRLSRLAPATVEMLERASVLGTDFEIPVLALMAGSSDEDLLTALDGATAAHLIEPVTGAGLVYRFSHALVADALYARISVARRAMLHRDAGRALELAPGAPDLQRLAHHWSLAAGLGEADRAVRYLRGAGREAFSGAAPIAALRHFRAALALMAPDEDDRCEALLEIGEAERRVPGEDHRSTFLAAAALARTRGDVERLARAAKGISRGFVILGPEPDAERLALLREANRALAASAPTDPLRVEILAASAGELRIAREDGASRELIAEAVAMARDLGDDAVLVHALATCWDVEFHPSTIATRAEIAKELAVVVDTSTSEAEALIRAAWVGFGVALETEDDDEAVASLAALRATAVQTSDPETLWRAHVTRATWAMRQGDLEAALALVDEALAMGRELGLVEVVAAHAAQSVLVSDRMGRDDELGTRLPEQVMVFPAGRVAAALRDATSGETREARRRVDEFVGPEGLVLPLDVTWPFSVAVLARTAALLGHAPLARAVEAELAVLSVVRLAHPTYDAGTVAAARALVAPLL